MGLTIVPKLTIGDKTLIREHVSGEGYFSSNAQEVHFGLGSAKTIDTLTITWPTGKIQSFVDVQVDQTLELVEPHIKGLAGKFGSFLID